jgi:urease beta subunit
MTDLAPYDRLSTMASLAVTFGLAGVLLFGWILAVLGAGLVALLRARALLASVTDPRRLRAGAALLQGIVRVTDGPAVTVEVHQRRVVRRFKHHQELHWTEFHRTCNTRDFTLELPAGLRVRVEPGARVDLVDLLGEPELLPTTHPPVRKRVRRAVVDAGDAVFVRGVLEGSGRKSLSGSYRSAEAFGWVLRPDVNGLFVSSEPVADPLARRSRVHLTWSLLGLVAALWLQLGVLADFRALHVQGEVQDAALRALPEPLWRGRSRAGTQFYLEAVAVRGEPLRDEVNREAWNRALFARTVPFTVSRANPRLHQVGDGEVGLSRQDASVVLLVVLFLVLGHGLSLKASRRWYERPKVVDREPFQGASVLS